jgi:hypothetical protein
LLNGPLVAEFEHPARLTVKPIPLTFLPYSLFPKDEIYNNINSQLDATIIILLIISISSTCFGR